MTAYKITVVHTGMSLRKINIFREFASDEIRYREFY